MNRNQNENPAAKRISLPLTNDGQEIDWAHVRPSTASRFEGLLRTDPNIRKAYEEENHISSDEPEMDFGITESTVGTLLDGIAKINAMLFQIVAAKWIKHPLVTSADGKKVPFIIEPDSLQKMQFTPEQHAELDPRAVRIAKKYERKMPDWLKQNFDLYIFGAMFISYTAENAKAVITAQVQKDFIRLQQAAAKQQQAKAAGVRPADTDVPKPNGAGAAAAEAEEPGITFGNAGEM